MQPVNTELIQVAPGRFESGIPGSSPAFPVRVRHSRFESGIPGLSLHLPIDGSGPMPEFRLTWGGSEMVLPRLADSEMLPFEMIFQKGLIEEGVEALLAAKQEHHQSFPSLEGMLNTAGYVHLNQGTTDAAIRIFELNVLLFPASSNVYDSLGEAYMEAGRDQDAVANYQRSMQLDPGNDNAREMLRRLERRMK